MSEKDPQRQIKNSDFDIPFFVDKTTPPDHKCGGCEHRIKVGNKYTCLLVDKMINLNRGTCLLWEEGEEKYKPEDIKPSRATPETAGYIEADLVNCSTCMHYSNEYCNLWTGKVKPGNCCDVWEQPKKDEKPYQTWSEFKYNKLDKIQ
jgi:hypothetical protein